MVIHSIFWIWLFYFVVNTAETAIDGVEHQLLLVCRRLLVVAVGVLLTAILYRVLRRFDSSGISIRLALAFTLSAPTALLLASFNYYSFVTYFPVSLFREHPEYGLEMRSHPLQSITSTALDSYFLIAGWAAIYIALSSAAQGRRAEMRAARYRTEAQSAELRALRYQLNPHFLFNTLNSLSALVMRGTPDQAERMIETLSAFLRTTLTGDASEDATLAEEMRVQRLYLDIEQVRFPDRLLVRIDIPAALETARIPGLLLQPLVENALKYGVAPTIRPVTIHIRARNEGGRLHLEIQDDGSATAGVGSGHGVGLRNVAARLLARYGTAARCSYGQLPEGGFRVELVLPLDTAVRGSR